MLGKSHQTESGEPWNYPLELWRQTKSHKGKLELALRL